MSEYHIEQAQQLLKEAGHYTGEVDGDFGPASLAAVKSAIAALDKHEPVPVLSIGNYILSERSLRKLSGVHPDLVKVVKRAIQITKVDFMVNEGSRTLSRQKRLVARGASKTLKSKHIGGRAVDLIPCINGKPNFANWDNYYPVAKAMQTAANELGVRIRWGGCWAFINDKSGDPKQWVADYVAWRKSKGRSAFIDGPHFDLG